MSSRALVGLAAALVILVGLAVFAHRSDTPAEPDAGGLFLPDLQAKLNDIDRIEVVSAGKAPVATLVRRESGWVVTQKDDYPADIAKVRSVLLDLAEANIVEQKTSNPDYYSRLGVEAVDDAKARGLLLMLKQGDASLAAVTIGNEAGNGFRYVRREGVPASYLVDKRIDAPREAAKWVISDVIDLRGDRVRQVEIARPGEETLTLSKATREQQNFTVEKIPEGRELQYPGVANVTGGALRELHLEDVAAATENTSPAVTTTYRTFDGLVVAVKGFEEGDDRWIELEASVDETQAASGAQPTAETTPASEAKPASEAESESVPKANSESEAKPGSANTETSTAPDPAAEAEMINARVRGWRYKVASYQYDQMTRRMDDLLKAKAEASK